MKFTDIYKNYFVAANGFDGFKSYFDYEFNPLEYEKIFILKGGPGTGKSSLMKKTAGEFKSNEYDIYNIYCSSDINSLDGLIIKKGNKKIAILDGTAPHTCDPSYPGCIECIFNLGENWDESKLEEKRDYITALTKQKKENYIKAYKALNNAKYLYISVNQIMKNALRDSIYSVFEKYNFKDTSKIERTQKEHRLTDAFGKDGLVKISNDLPSEIKTVTIENKYQSADFFMQSLADYLTDKNIPYITVPSPLSDEIISEIITDEYIFKSSPDSADIKVSEYINQEYISNNEKMLDNLWQSYKNMLELSKEYFTYASKKHFALEEIYIGAMNFQKNDTVITDLIHSIRNHL